MLLASVWACTAPPPVAAPSPPPEPSEPTSPGDPPPDTAAPPAPAVDCTTLPAGPAPFTVHRVETSEDFDFDAEGYLVYVEFLGTTLVGVDTDGERVLLS